MFFYEKKLQYPVKITTPNPKLAAFIISQYGGLDSNRLQSLMPTPAGGSRRQCEKENESLCDGYPLQSP
jgi:hypothetical protein